MPAIQVLIAEDETMMRRLLVRRLSTEQDIRVIGEAENGRQAVDMALELKPDVVIMDLNMPLVSGAEATERITTEVPTLRVIVLTSLGGLAPIGRMSGAFECLDKSCTPEELVAAIRRANAARAETPAAAARAGYSDAVERLSNRHGLTPYERTVLECVVGTELTVHQIANRLSTDLGEKVTDSSVKHALERIMNKLRIDPRTRAALIKHVLEFERAR